MGQVSDLPSSDLSTREPSSVFQRSTNMLLRELRISGKDLICSFPSRKLLQEEINGNPRAPKAGFPHHHVRTNLDQFGKFHAIGAPPNPRGWQFAPTTAEHRSPTPRSEKPWQPPDPERPRSCSAGAARRTSLEPTQGSPSVCIGRSSSTGFLGFFIKFPL